MGREMKNLKIGKKLLVTFGVIVVLFCITVIMSLYSLTAISNEFKQFYNGPFPITNQASDLRTSIQAAAKNIGYAAMTSDQQKTEEYVENARASLKALQEGMSYIEENFRGDQSLITNYNNLMNDMAADRDKVLELALNNQNSEAAELYFSKVMPSLVKATEYLGQINDFSMNTAEEKYMASEKQKLSVTISLFILSGVALAVTVFLSVYITRALTKPIRELDSVANEMAEGNLKVSISYTSKDELGSLAESMRKMTERIGYYMSEISIAMSQLAQGDLNVAKREPFLGDFAPVQMSIRDLIGSLNSTLAQINESADQVAAGSDQLAGGAQALSQGATEQAASVEELAATINQISNQVESNAANAQDASEKAVETKGQMAESSRRMEQMVQAMGEITTSSNEIGKIIKSIEDIAFQTNILALNAAVEAARAGSAGKGFAVVADEVRSLATKASEASQNTSVLIEDSLKSIQNGAKIADETAQSLLAAAEGTNAVTETISRISKASKEQAVSIAQVTQGIDQISSVVQTNSATAEESAASSEELSGQAQILKSLTGQFKLKSTKGQVNTSRPQTQQSSPNILLTSGKY